MLSIVSPYAENIGRRQSRYSNTYWVPLFRLVLGHNSPRIGMYLLFVSFWNNYWEFGYEPDIETPIQTPFQTSDILLVLKHLSGNSNTNMSHISRALLPILIPIGYWIRAEYSSTYQEQTKCAGYWITFQDSEYTRHIETAMWRLKAAVYHDVYSDTYRKMHTRRIWAHQGVVSGSLSEAW